MFQKRAKLVNHQSKPPIFKPDNILEEFATIESQQAEPQQQEEQEIVLPQHCMDFWKLREIAVQHVLKLVGHIWTDYNLHDPGVTILEVLCYAVTDLGYRIDFDIKDLLAPYPLGRNTYTKSFYSALEILTCNPVTLTDYRCLIIDEPEVKNAWLVMKEDKVSEDLYVKGIYKVMLELEEHDTWGDLNSRMIKEVKLPYLEEIFDLEVSIVDRDVNWKEIKGIKKIQISKAEEDFVKFAKFSHLIRIVMTIELESGNKKEVDMRIMVDLLDSDGRILFPDFGVGNYTIGAEGDEHLVHDDGSWTFFVTDENEKIPFPEDSDHILVIPKTYKKSLVDYLTGGEFLSIMNTFLLPKKSYVRQIENKVFNKLHSYRNVCEDFESVNAIDIQEVVVNANILLHPNANAQQIMSQIFYQIGEHLCPTVKKYTLDEMKDKGRKIEEVFEGPILYHGFIDQEELKSIKNRTTIYASNIIKIIMKIDGVQAVRSLQLGLYKDGAELFEFQPDFIKLLNPNEYLPRISIAKSKIKFLKDEIPEKVKVSQVKRALRKRRKAIKDENKRKKVVDIPIPKGEYRDVHSYYSIQNDFPATYGIGEGGYPKYATPKRMAQTKQLRGYLIFFEQLLANYFAQLANVASLFSFTEDKERRTYFYQVLQDIPGIHEIIIDYNAERDIYIDGLKRLVENEGTYLQRKNQFLDHMMARFSEKFTDYAMIKYSLNGSEKVTSNALIDEKMAFLREYPILSGQRSSAFDYTDKIGVWNISNIAGMQKRTCRLVGIQNYNRRDLVAKTKKGEEPKPAQDGFYILEHLLLRPRPAGMDSNSLRIAKSGLIKMLKLDQQKGDYFSFQVSVLLPKQAEMFKNIRFRKLVEKTLREQAPAHVLLHIRWMDNKELKRFQDMYKLLLIELSNR